MKKQKLKGLQVRPIISFKRAVKFNNNSDTDPTTITTVTVTQFPQL
ncbi:MAG: hypothetical protein JWP94_50 [Mucilaginibacter sp.]|jgi:hypothetical protein|nr:hypothetical protein [Mucilaginibacter sp.]